MSYSSSKSPGKPSRNIGDIEKLAAFDGSKCRPIRVLCCHGSGTNSEFMALLQVGMSPFRSRYEFLYVDGPLEGTPPKETERFLSMIKLKKYYKWLEKDEKGQSYSGFQKAVDVVTDSVKKLGQIDVILGFSQGAVVASLAAQELASSSTNRIKAVVCVCGVDPLREGDRFDIPSFHIIGETDKLRERSLKLYSLFQGRKLIESHSEGHKFPSFKDRKIGKALDEFLSTICAV